jgi:RNA polymerase sigma factor (sigma-70 family)
MLYDLHDSFHNLLLRVRRGDESAARELVETYEPLVRRFIRVRLRDARMRRLFDSADICQSVLGDFFVRVAMGQYEIESRQQLVALLVTIARNKILHHVDAQYAACRDVRRTTSSELSNEVVAQGSTPSTKAAREELISQFRQLLTKEELYLADQRAVGKSWSELAAELDSKVDALRVRLSRAIDRVSEQLGLDAM